jgi:hypothetical protein
MKIYITNKAIQKLEDMVKNNRAEFISVRKYKKDKDPPENVIKGIKLTEKQRAVHKTGGTYRLYISKEKLTQVKRAGITEGGVIPFLPLLLGGLSAIGTLAGGSAAVAKTVIDKKANDERLEEERRHNKELESIAKGDEGDGLYLNPHEGAGECSKDLIKRWTRKLNTDDVGKKTIRNILRNVSDYVDLNVTLDGEGLFLTPKQN